jgi:hypothetical protein
LLRKGLALRYVVCLCAAVIPFSLLLRQAIECKSLRSALVTLNPAVDGKVMSRDQFTALGDVARAGRDAKLQEQLCVLKDQPFVLTFDGWSRPGVGKSLEGCGVMWLRYVGVVASCILAGPNCSPYRRYDDGVRVQCRLPAIEPLNRSKKGGKELAQWVRDVFSRYNLHWDDIKVNCIGAVTDTASDVKLAAQLLGIKHISCLAHVIDLCLKTGKAKVC